MPAVFAVVAGQAMPLFQGAAPEDQITEVLDQLIAVAEQRFGIVGAEVEPDAAEQPPAERRRRGRPPRRSWRSAPPTRRWTPGDLGGAIQAYRNVLADEPANAEAKLGLAQAELLRRVQGADPHEVRQAAADAPGDVRRSSRRPTWTWSAVTSRTPSGGWWTPCAAPRARTGTAYGCGCWSCSR